MTGFCAMNDCDQEPLYCRGHYEEECKREERSNLVAQTAAVHVLVLLRHLERLGVENVDVEAARKWLG